MDAMTRNAFLRKTAAAVLFITAAFPLAFFDACSKPDRNRPKKRVWKQRTNPLTKRHEEYIAYYRARVQKYKNNPMYTHSLEAELRMLEAVENSEDLAEFRKIVSEDLIDVDVARALIKDQETARMKMFNDLKETTRAETSKNIIASVDSVNDVADINDTVARIMQKGNTGISQEQYINYVYYDFLYLENIEVWEKAQVPEKWRAKLNGWAADARKSAKDNWTNVIMPAAKKTDPAWKLDYRLMEEHRHRRLIPIPDSALKRRIAEHKKMLEV
jgi:hypothetical protein